MKKLLKQIIIDGLDICDEDGNVSREKVERQIDDAIKDLKAETIAETIKVLYETNKISDAPCCEPEQEDNVTYHVRLVLKNGNVQNFNSVDEFYLPNEHGRYLELKMGDSELIFLLDNIISIEVIPNNTDNTE